MIKIKLLAICFSIIFSCSTVSLFAEEGGGFENSALGKQLIDFGLKFLDNPGDFFFNLHADNEDFSPLPQDKIVSLRFNFFPTVFPATWANFNIKGNILKEKGYYPQIDLVGMYGDMLALRAMQSAMDDVKPSFNDYSLGAVVSKGVNNKTRIFGGLKYASVNMEIKFSTPVAMGTFEMSLLDFKVADTFFFSGITHQVGSEKYIVAQIGYGFYYKKIVSRIMTSYRHLELGVDIFPEGLFVIQPFMAWHWYF